MSSFKPSREPCKVGSMIVSSHFTDEEAEALRGSEFPKVNR